MTSLHRSSSTSSTTEMATRHASVTFSDSSTIINEPDEGITPPARVFPNDEVGSRVILPDPFNSDDDGEDLEDLEDEDPTSPVKKPSRRRSRLSDSRSHVIVPAPSTRGASKKRVSSGSMKPLKFSSADGRAYGTLGYPRGRRRSVRSLMERNSRKRSSICRLERHGQAEGTSAGSRAGFVMFLVVMNAVFLGGTVFCIVWPATRRQWDKIGCVVVPVSLWMAFILVTASSWRVVKTCECPPESPPRREAERSKSKRRSSGPLFPMPAVWLDQSQRRSSRESDSEATEV